MEKAGVLDRRRFIELSASLAAAAAHLGCGSSSEPPGPVSSGRLSVTWKAPTGSLGPGEHALGLGDARDGFIRMPEGYRPETPAPLALLLHGAGSDAHGWAGGFPMFDQFGMIVLGVDSRLPSWDLGYGVFGPDVDFIDSALARTFESCNVDPARMGIAGFSDGASYALSLGLTNGDLFTHVLGFSPGFVQTDGRRGQPPVFLSHGSADPILAVSFTRQLADQLRAEGHEVLYEEFNGGHALPSEISEMGFSWLVDGGQAPPRLEARSKGVRREHVLR